MDVNAVCLAHDQFLKSREVLGLYRTREWAGCPHEHGGIARVRYSDLGSRSVCGGRGCYANSIEEE
jgi:hypothetical protein